MRLSLDEREEIAARKRRAAATYRKWNEERPWHLVCPACEHEGWVTTTLKRLKASNLKCSACGSYLWRSQ
jgi:transcription elongation factor Elf1